MIDVAVTVVTNVVLVDPHLLAIVERHRQSIDGAAGTSHDIFHGANARADHYLNPISNQARVALQAPLAPGGGPGATAICGALGGMAGAQAVIGLNPRGIVGLRALVLLQLVLILLLLRLILRIIGVRLRIGGGNLHLVVGMGLAAFASDAALFCWI